MMLLANSLSKPRREQIKREQQENDIEIVKVKKKGLKNSVWGPYCFQGSFNWRCIPVQKFLQIRIQKKPIIDHKDWIFTTTD